MKAIAIADAMASPKLFAPFFAGPSWKTWRVVIKAMAGEALNAVEVETFRSRRRARSADRTRK